MYSILNNPLSSVSMSFVPYALPCAFCTLFCPPSRFLDLRAPSPIPYFPVLIVLVPYSFFCESLTISFLSCSLLSATFFLRLRASTLQTLVLCTLVPLILFTKSRISKTMVCTALFCTNYFCFLVPRTLFSKLFFWLRFVAYDFQVLISVLRTSVLLCLQASFPSFPYSRTS